MATAAVSGLEGPRRTEASVSVLVAVGAAGALATGVTAWAVARSPILVDPKSVSIWRGLIVASYVAVGLYRWWRRPDSRLGPLLMGNGFLYAATSFNASGASPAYTLGMVMWAVYVVYTAYLLLSYPGGRLESRLERAFIRVYALSTAVLWSLILALSPTFPGAGSFNDCGTRCPPNALVGGDAVIGTALNTAASIVFTIALIGLTMLLFDKARASGLYPFRAEMASAITSPWRGIACAIASGAVSQRRVDPSTSVSRNVTVPRGRETTIHLRPWTKDPLPRCDEHPPPAGCCVRPRSAT